MLDFDDLLLLWRAAALDDRLGPRLASSCDHILVDEYQDVNGLQVDILRALRRADERITIVGDDAQAVYSFRAAEPRHILDFEQTFAGARTVILSTNYRSSQEILDVANSVAAEAPEGFSAVLHAANARAGMRPISSDAPMRIPRFRRSASRYLPTERKASPSKSKQCWCAPRTTRICSNLSLGVDEYRM